MENEIKDELDNYLRSCTISEKYCGKRDQNGLCESDYCRYQRIHQILLGKSSNHESTVEFILKLEKNRCRPLSVAEILAITPISEILIDNGIYIVDKKGNILNVRNRRIIRRNWRKRKVE